MRIIILKVVKSPRQFLKVLSIHCFPSLQLVFTTSKPFNSHRALWSTSPTDLFEARDAEEYSVENFLHFCLLSYHTLTFVPVSLASCSQYSVHAHPFVPSHLMLKLLKSSRTPGPCFLFHVVTTSDLTHTRIFN